MLEIIIVACILLIAVGYVSVKKYRSLKRSLQDDAAGCACGNSCEGCAFAKNGGCASHGSAAQGEAKSSS